MTIIIYLLSIVGSLAVLGGVYYLIKKYASAYLVVTSIGAGVVAAKIILAKDLSIIFSIGVVIACGSVSGIFAIPALLMSDIEDLKEQIGNPETKKDNLDENKKA